MEERRIKSLPKEALKVLRVNTDLVLILKIRLWKPPEK